jgi:ankyrin repeat protein
LALAEEVATWCRPKLCERLFNLGANPFALDSEGESSVHHAASKGNVQFLQYMFKDYQSVDIVNGKGETPLMKAILGNHEEVVEWLLNQRADIQAKTLDGKSCLHFAAEVGNCQWVEIFEDNEHGMHPMDDRGWTALFYTSSNGHADCLKYLLSKSANPKHHNRERDTSLHVASGSKHGLQCVKLLLANIFQSTAWEKIKKLHFIVLQIEDQTILLHYYWKRTLIQKKKMKMERRVSTLLLEKDIYKRQSSYWIMVLTLMQSIKVVRLHCSLLRRVDIQTW